MTTFEKYHNFLNGLEEANQHTAHLGRAVISSWLTTGAVLLSVLPELFGVVATAQQYAWAWAAAIATLSVVGIGVAMQKCDKDRPITWLWFAPYAGQLVISIAVIKLNGGGVEMFGPLLSLIGAIYAWAGVDEADQMRKAAKADQRDDTLFDLELEKQRIRLEEMKAKSKARTAAYQQERGIRQPDSPNLVADSDGKKVVISADKSAEGGEKGRKTQRTKADARRETLLGLLIERYPGKALKDITYKSMGSMVGVTGDTARRDIEALRSAGRINGVVPNVPTSSNR